MSASIFKRKIEIPKPVWWLWICLSIPPSIYLFSAPYDRGGWEISDWNYLVDYSRHYELTQLPREFWREVGLALFSNCAPSIGGGWIAHCFILFFWRVIRQRRTSAQRVQHDHAA